MLYGVLIYVADKYQRGMGQGERYIKDKTWKAKWGKDVNGISELETLSWLLGVAKERVIVLLDGLQRNKINTKAWRGSWCQLEQPGENPVESHKNKDNDNLNVEIDERASKSDCVFANLNIGR